MKQRLRRSREEWARIFDKQARSGLSARSFCELENISVSSFYRWRGRLGAPAASSLDPEEAPSPFIELGGIGSVGDGGGGGGGRRVEASTGLEITLDLGDGIRLTLRRF